MTGIRVPVPEEPGREYGIRVDPGGLDRLGDLCAAAAPAHRYAVIADSHVAELYGKRSLAALTDSGLDADLFTFPSGEWNKSATEWARLCAELMIEGFGLPGAKRSRSSRASEPSSGDAGPTSHRHDGERITS